MTYQPPQSPRPPVNDALYQALIGPDLQERAKAYFTKMKYQPQPIKRTPKPTGANYGTGYDAT